MQVIKYKYIVGTRRQRPERSLEELKVGKLVPRNETDVPTKQEPCSCVYLLQELWAQVILDLLP